MRCVEFVVRDEVPPRNVGKKSMWRHETETPRVIEFRRSAREAFGDREPLSRNIRLTIEIRIPADYNEPGDLDNFIKGICDGLRKPKEALINPNFRFHETFNLPENRDIHPERFEVIKDDRDIVEIHATMSKESEDLNYKVTIEGE